ncbi:MAG: FtsX-like permease family protein [Rhodothermales bacterium]|nr:FtsX-like permease family protein [Rhodothermales bacterium]
MLANYLRIALRSFRRYTGYALINLTGLVTGLVCVLLIGVYIRHEVSYDRFHDNADRIERVVLDLSTPDGVSHLPTAPGALAGVMEETIPEVEKTVRLYKPEETSVRIGDVAVRETGLLYVDESFTDVFTVDVLHGDANSPLAAPGSVVLTDEAAVRYFGSPDAVGRILVIGDTLDVQVTAVVRPFPTNSHFRFSALVSMDTMKRFFPDIDERWSPHIFFTYALLQPGVNPASIDSRVTETVSERVSFSSGYSFSFLTQPITEIHLHSDRGDELGANSSTGRVLMFGVVALFVLLIACLNFMNLTTARSSTRSREVGMRKVLGARKMQLVSQFAGEAVTYAVISAVIAWVVAWAVFPMMRSISGVPMSRDVLLSADVVLALAVLALVVGLIAGSYPSFFLSSFRPLTVLRSGSGTQGGGAGIRKVLVVGQFVISMFMLVGTVIVLRQIDFMQSSDLGFEDDQIVVLSGLNAHQLPLADRFRAEAGRLAGVRAVSASHTVPGRSIFSLSYRVASMPEGEFETIRVLFADPDFNDVYDVDLLAGRDLSREFGDDSTTMYLLTRSAALESGWQPEEAVGQEVILSRGPGLVAGVIEDFHFHSLRERMQPLLIHSRPIAYASAPLVLSVRLGAGDIRSALSQLERVWIDVSGGLPFDYSFLDEEFDRQYRADERMARLLTVFGGMAILIACLGLFGLATLTAERRRREIGIRKVLGAGVAELAATFTLDFMKLVAVAFVVAAPLTWLAAETWLKGFAYRIDPGVLTFMAGGLALALLAALTVSYHSVRAATENPVEALRSE